MDLYAHQLRGIEWLPKHSQAMLADEMGLGKTRQVLIAAQNLYAAKKIDRVLVFAPASVRGEWRKEMDKIEADGMSFVPCVYDPKAAQVYGAGKREGNPLPVLVVSYALLPQKKHVQALLEWCMNGRAAMICDESSFLANRGSKQSKRCMSIGARCWYRWLLTGTPIANSPLDLWSQGLAMSGKKIGKFIKPAGPLEGFQNFAHFRATYAEVKAMKYGHGPVFMRETGTYRNINQLSRKFAPYVLRRTKAECLDLPEKTYMVREIPLSAETWRTYQELKKEALLCLPDSEERPEPNAAVRILRLCQLTSGYVGQVVSHPDELMENQGQDVSSEKLDWMVEQILEGELSTQQAIIVWCRWRRERIRLREALAGKIDTYGVFGGQQERNRSAELGLFATSQKRRVLVAQQHAGGFGLNLTAASTAVYFSNSFSFTDRIQSEDRIHRINQKNACLYIDVVATGPNSQHTVDHHVLECLRNKKSVADETCSGWRRVLNA